MIRDLTPESQLAWTGKLTTRILWRDNMSVSVEPWWWPHKDLKTKEADSESAEKLTNALDSANKNYKDLMESKEKLSADFEDYKQRSESTIETMQTSMNDKDTQLDETKAKLEKLQSELNDAHQKIQYHERNDQAWFRM